MNSMKLVVAGALCAVVSVGAWAGEKEDAQQLVAEAVAHVGKDKAAAVAEIGKPKGRYVKGEVYVFAYDLNGVMVAHPMNSKLVGKSLLDVPDAAGKMFRKEIVSGVTAAGSATVDYKYKNPTSGAIEDKVTVCKKAADLAVCAGYYK